MLEQQSTTDTYHFPGSQEAIISRTPEVLLSEADLARAAVEQAVSAHEVDSNDIDTRRVESFGASTVAAAEARTIAPVENYFNPTDFKQLAAVGYHVVNMRKIAMGIDSNERAA